MTKRYTRMDGVTIVAKPARRYDGAVGLYGCDANFYERSKDFSCGARYYFEDDLDLLTELPNTEA